MHPPDVGSTQPRLLVFDFFPDSPTLTKLVIQSLDIHSLKLIQPWVVDEWFEIGYVVIGITLSEKSGSSILIADLADEKENRA